MRCVLVLIAITLAQRPADACSMRSELFIRPTFVERVEQAVSIVVAELVPSEVDPQSISNMLPFVVLELFKGPVKPGARIIGTGSIHHQMCGGPPVRAGDQYVVFLDANGWPVHQESMRAKDMASRYALSELVRITSIANRADRTAALAGARTHAKRKLAVADEAMLASYIDQHFDTPTPWKTFAELQPMLAAKPKKYDEIIHSIGLGADPAAKAFMTETLHKFRGKRPLPREELHAIVAYFAKVKSPAAASDLLWLHDMGAKAENWPWKSELFEAGRLHQKELHEVLHASP